MADKKVNASYYNLNKAVLIPEIETRGLVDTVSQTDITGLIPALSFDETIENGIMVGSVQVLDTVGLLENFPIRGEERLILEIEDSTGNIRSYDLFVHSVSDVEISDTSDMTSYYLHFVSYQSFLAASKKIIRPFRNLTASQIASQLFDEYYTPSDVSYIDYTVSSNIGGQFFDATRKDFTVEDTDGNLRIIIPKMSTQQAMDLLAGRSFSSASPSCSFRFFESADKFYFVSDEWFMKNSPVFDFTYYDIIPKDGLQFVAELNNLETLSNITRIDTLDDLYSGGYRNRVLELDIMRRQVNLNEEGYSYFDRREAYFPNRDPDFFQDRHTESFMDLFQTPENAKQFLIFKDFSEDSEKGQTQIRGNQMFKQIVENKVAFRNHLNSITVSATGPGRLDITVGDIVNLSVPLFNATTEEIKDLNTQLSGQYLVKDLSREMEREEYKNHYTLVKMNWINR